MKSLRPVNMCCGDYVEINTTAVSIQNNNNGFALYFVKWIKTNHLTIKVKTARTGQCQGEVLLDMKPLSYNCYLVFEDLWSMLCKIFSKQKI